MATTAKKRVLVCGATGFIGRNLAERFSRFPAYEVVGTHFKRKPFSCPNLNWISVDLTQRDQVQDLVGGFDIVVQAAATTSGAKDIVSKPYYHVTDNAIMNSLLFRAAFEQKVKQLIFFSCTIMYPSSEIPLCETDFDANCEPYASYFGASWTKVYCEKMCEFYSRIGSTKYTVIRHSNIYGPHDKYDLEHSHVFGATVCKVMTAQDGKIQVWGTGEEERDLLYIDDLVEFVQAALEKQTTPFELVNVGLGRSIAIRDLVQKIIDISGRNLRIDFATDKPTLKTKLCLNTEKAFHLFGWKPKVTLDQGIAKTLAWYRDR